MKLKLQRIETFLFSTVFIFLEEQNEVSWSRISSDTDNVNIWLS